MNTVFQVSESAREEYRQRGVTVLRGVVSQQWLDALSAAIERDIENPGPFYHGYQPENGQGRFHGNLRLWQNDPTFREFCLESSLPGIAAQFFGGGRINLLYDQLFVKEPGTQNRTRWHNDQPYWPVRGSQVVSLWIALDRVTADSGALEFVSGSNQWDRWFQPRRFGESAADDDYEINPDYEEMPDIESARQDYDIVTWELQPGDCYVFNGMTVHGAGGNTDTKLRRRGYTVRYTGDNVRYDTRAGTSEPLRDSTLSDGDKLDGELYPIIVGE